MTLTMTDYAMMALTYIPMILYMAGVFDKGRTWGTTSLIMVGVSVYFLIWDHDLGSAGIWAFWAVWSAYMWWKNRRKGGWKKAARRIGAKSKAWVEALVRQITPSPIPSPVGA